MAFAESHTNNFKNELSLLLFSVISLCVITAHASGEPVEFFGDYSDVRSATGEHCEGYNIMLWKYKGSLIGFLNHHRGLCGDPPMGILEETVYSASTGNLSFNVKLSDGCIPQGDKCVPTKDKITFKGELNGEILEGVVSWYREDMKKPLSSEKIKLSKNLKRSHNRNYATYDDWIKYWGPILKARGPQW
jgi:hypothetical protein